MKETLKRTMLSLGVLMICAFILPDFTEAWHLSERNTLSIEEMKLLKGAWLTEFCIYESWNTWCPEETCTEVGPPVGWLLVYPAVDKFPRCRGSSNPSDKCCYDEIYHTICWHKACAVIGCHSCGEPSTDVETHYATLGDKCQ